MWGLRAPHSPSGFAVGGAAETQTKQSTISGPEALSPDPNYEFTGSGAVDVTKPHRLLWVGDIDGPKPFILIGFRWPSSA